MDYVIIVVKVKNFLKIFALLFVLFSSVFLVSSVWHIFAPPEQNSFYLNSFDTVSYSDACFELGCLGPCDSQSNVLATVSGREVVSDSISGNAVKEFCFPISSISAGQNKLLVSAGDQTLFYHFLVSEKDISSKKIPSAYFDVIGNNLVKFYVSGFPEGRHSPVSIVVNGNLDHSVYPPSGDSFFSERVFFGQGENSVSLFFEGKEIASSSKQLSVTIPKSIPLVGLLFLTFSVSILFVAFSDRGLLFASAFSFVSYFLITVILSFVLSLFSVFTEVVFVILFLAVIVSIAFAKRSNFSKIPDFDFKKYGFFLAALAIVVLFILFVPHLFTQSHHTFFNTFYERGSAMFVDSSSLPLRDSFSYLGRDFSFVPGYFFIESATSYLTGFSGKPLFATMLLLSMLSLVSCSSLFFRSLLSRKNFLIAPLLLLSSSFIFTAVTVTPRHGIAIALLFAGLYSVFRLRIFSSALILGIASFVQLPILAGFAFVYPFLQKKPDYKKLLKVFALAFSFFVVLFSPILLAIGIPYQTTPFDWGYLIKLPLEYLLVDQGILFMVSLFALGLSLFSRRPGLPVFSGYSKKLFAGILIAFLLNVFVSSRMNLFVSIILVGFVASLFEALPKIQQKQFKTVFAFVLLFSLFSSPAIVSVTTLDSETIAGLKYVQHNASTNANILADPVYGHAVAFISERKVLADLMVEYASEFKLNDAYKFLLEEDYSILSKYSISFVLNKPDKINRNAWQLYEIDGRKKIEFEELNKVFSNNSLFVHFVPK